MANNDNKQQGQENNQEQAESNAERDRDHGNMNNGTLGGNMGIIGNSNEPNAGDTKKADEGTTSAVAGDNSKGAGTT